jgi:hypothetical protein
MHHGAVWKVLIANAGWVLQEIFAAGAVNAWLPLDATKWACGRKTLTVDTWGAAFSEIKPVAPFNLMAAAHVHQAVKDSSASGFAKPRQAYQKWNRQFLVLAQEFDRCLILVLDNRAELLQIHFDGFPVVCAATWPRLVCKRFRLGALWHARG